ncbi:reverse transcriptase, partial [Tanacetum coccineum]
MQAWNNYVPTIDNLQSRGLSQTFSCTHCGGTTKNIVHVMFKCSAAKEVWNRYEWEIFMMILWGLWIRRNKRSHDQLNGREGNVEAVAKFVLSEHHMANQREITT